MSDQPNPDTESLAGVARDATSIREVLDAFERHGFTVQMAARGDGEIECFSCHRRFDATDAEIYELRRLEGASDPDDELAIAAVRCYHCHALGTLVLTFGPSAPEEDQLVLERLAPAPTPLRTDRDGPARGTA
jgi:hypothetical protein